MRVENIAWDHKNFDQFSELIKVIASRLSKFKIATKIGITNNGLIFNPVDGTKIAISTVDNKVMMKPDDPRIQKKGRNYLDTKRLTKEQYDNFFGTVQNVLDELNVKANITLVDKTTYVLRNGKNKVLPPTLKSYPVAK